MVRQSTAQVAMARAERGGASANREDEGKDQPIRRGFHGEGSIETSADPIGRLIHCFEFGMVGTSSSGKFIQSRPLFAQVAKCSASPGRCDRARPRAITAHASESNHD